MIITDFIYKTVKDTITGITITITYNNLYTSSLFSVNDTQMAYDNIELKMTEFLIKFSPTLSIGIITSQSNYYQYHHHHHF